MASLGIYQSLDPSQKEVRLLYRSIIGEDLESVPSYEHQSVSLQDAARPNYEAVSYCWTELPGFKPVRINGVLTSAPASALHVLTSLLKAGTDRRLWIDALCIDQENLAERSAQVALMHEVYAKSQRVLIWLGDADSATSQGLHTLDLIKSDLDADPEGWQEAWEHLVVREEPKFESKDPLPAACSVSAVRSLLQRKWYARLWVLQEAILAPNACCHFGDSQVTLELLCQVAVWICYKKFTSRWTYPPKCHLSINTLLLIARYKASGHVRIGNLLKISANKEVEEPKDKVYGMLALYPDIPLDAHSSSQIVADYEQPRAAVYADATWRAIRQDGHLEVLRLADPSSGHPMSDQSNAWPSWVPTLARYHNGLRTAIETRYSADAQIPTETSLQTNIRSNRYALYVRGIVADTVAACCPSVLSQPSFRHLIRYLFDVLSFLRQHHLIGDGRQQLSTAVLRTLTCHKWLDPAVLETACLQLEEYIGNVKVVGERGEESWTPATKAIMHALRLTCRNRCVFVTVTGRVGIGPGDTRGGDGVHVLFGEGAPYVLRSVVPHPDEDSSGQETEQSASSREYQLVGHCYLDGIMEGEAVREHESTGKPTESFILV
ncbi:hypothetical protein LTR53_013343 [Teratosphaeriaceae sp. CCFEE 6253]|nr:hypothetical protein LTR53_013343 [Teratosphaeriaceae sp. CCFEE 6253]